MYSIEELYYKTIIQTMKIIKLEGLYGDISSYTINIISSINKEEQEKIN